MIDNKNGHFNDFWFTGNLQDCGATCGATSNTKNNDTIIIKSVVYSEKPEKLNNKCKSNIKNTIYNDNSIEQNNIIKRTNYNNHHSRKSNRTNKSQDKYKNANSGIINEKNTNFNCSLSKNVSTNYNKGQMYNMHENSRIHEYKHETRKVLLDSFSKPRMKCYE
jgi:hypothetical protein